MVLPELSTHLVPVLLLVGEGFLVFLWSSFSSTNVVIASYNSSQYAFRDVISIG